MLSSYIQNKNCVHCLMNKCFKNNNNKVCSNNNKKINKNDVDLFAKYVNNPFLFTELEKNIKNVDIKINNFDNKEILKNGFMITTCLFCLSKNNWNVCKNVKEGRFNTITLNDTNITYCYPELKNVKHRIQIGLHMDLKIENNSISYDFIENNKIENNKIENKNLINNIKENEDKSDILSKVSYVNVVKNKEVLNENKNIVDNIKYQQLYQKYEKLKDKYIFLQNSNKKNNVEIKNISLNAQLHLLNMEINELETILKNKDLSEDLMDIFIDNEIKATFQKIF